jgi:ADP-ribose pyrophosphatase
MKKDLNKNPWKTLDSKTVYDNPWIEVIENKVINPSGGDGIYGVVSFKNIAVGIVPLDEHYNTWLVGQYRYTLNEYSWEIPEGGCLIGSESTLIAAQRELLEETGLHAEKWTEILKMHTSNSVTDEVAYTFVAQGLSEGDAAPEETEDLQVMKLPFDKAIEMCLNNEITDAFSIGSLFKAKVMIENKML